MWGWKVDMQVGAGGVRPKQFLFESAKENGKGGGVEEGPQTVVPVPRPVRKS